MLRMTETRRRDAWVWPFPRLRYWLRHGRRCTHNWLDWEMIDLGRRKRRRCARCEHAEITP